MISRTKISFSFQLEKQNFITVGPLEKCFGNHLEKSTVAPPGKIPSDAYVIQYTFIFLLQLVNLIISYIKWAMFI